jgi:hypothetical protein
MTILGTQQSPIKIETSQAIYTPLDSRFLKFNYSKPLQGHLDLEDIQFLNRRYVLKTFT